MAMTVRLDDEAADVLRLLAEREQRPVDAIASEAVRAHAERARAAGQEDLAAEVARVRSDTAFVETLDALADRDREILDRLAE